MRLLIIDEKGIREFTPLKLDNKNENESNSIIKFLKEKLDSKESLAPKKELNLYTISKLVELFQTTRPTLYNWIEKGDLTPIRIGGRVFFNQIDIEEMLLRKSFNSITDK
ncbi:helix-turn-helix domain-containing protein [Polaribacter cellanae]|uniref:Helix-turn-helix domain-containing protein n=1 Tax=Polaribacter cellanae TaxID=2818493 RepID=A0A975CJC4_9FLAO|nr:helix-turn-helix domain-containing protein [Polaribacter cellanae]QTE21021.1 helix-turn-helix domain-containing protein [Polaribacter cellanae]